MRKIDVLALTLTASFSALIIGIAAGMYIEKHYLLQVTPKPKCTGYVKIAHGKAVDCYGDTIRIKEFHETYKEYQEQQRKLQSK